MDATYNLSGGFKPTLKRFADLDGPDFFPTPAWATYALIDNEKFAGDIWECACGDGAMSAVLGAQGNKILSSDLFQRGFGEAGVDFLRADRRASNIVTNPPYNSAEGFVTEGLKKATSKFALLLRLAFLEGGNRQTRFLHESRQAEFGFLASGSRSIRLVLSEKGRGQPLTLGLLGIETQQVPSSNGSSRATKRAIRDPVTTAQNSARAL